MKVSIDHSGCMDPCNQDAAFLNIPICLDNTDVSRARINGKDCRSTRVTKPQLFSVVTSTSATQYFGPLKTPS